MIRKTIEFTDENILSLFGFEDAESESIERLREYYLKSDTYTRVTSDVPLRILVGHKGIGKSALFKMSYVDEQEKGNLTVLIKPDDIAELGKTDENFLLKIRQWKLGLTKIIGSKVFSEFGIADDSNVNKLGQFGLKLISYIHETISGIKNKIDIAPTNKLLLERFLTQRKIIVYIDDLDRGWEGKKDDINRLSALLNCVRDLSSENVGLQFRITLRTDVYFLVRTSDESTDKIESSVIWHSWTNHQILVMLVKRVLTFFGEKPDEQILLNTPQNHLASYLDVVMEKRFQGYGKWANVPIHQVLMSLIRRRPRDLVKLCTLAARTAYKDKSNIMRSKHFLDNFEDYSQGRIQDTINEYKSELPNIEKLLFGMKPSMKDKKTVSISNLGSTANDYSVFSTQDLIRKISNVSSQNTFTFASGRKATDKDLAAFLYKINFITARKMLDNGEIDRKYFDENRYILSSFVDFGYDWEIHPAHRWVLQPDSIHDLLNRISISSDS